MQFFRQKKIKGNKYYYLEFKYRYNGFVKTYTKFVGKMIPNEISKFLKDFFSYVSEQIYIEYWKNQEIKQKYFPQKSYYHIEKQKLHFMLLNHSVFRKEYNLFRTLFNILFILNSNRAEGSKITREDLELIIKGKKKPRTAIDIEILNSFKAFDFAINNMKLSLKDIKQLHWLLLKNLHVEAGQFKRTNNIVGSGFDEASITSNWKDVEQDLKKLIEWFNSRVKEKYYLPKLILEFHYKYEKIHPFIDGNGRTGRLIMNAMLIRAGYFPVIFFSENHRSYSNAISKSISGNFVPLAKHFVESLKKTVNAIEKYKKEGIIKGGSNQIGNWEISKGRIRLY